MPSEQTAPRTLLPEQLLEGIVRRRRPCARLSRTGPLRGAEELAEVRLCLVRDRLGLRLLALVLALRVVELAVEAAAQPRVALRAGGLPRHLSERVEMGSAAMTGRHRFA